MNISLTIDENYQSHGSGATSFNAPDFFSLYSHLLNSKAFSGVVTIDGREIKFSYSPYFDDGDIESSVDTDRFMVKQIAIAHAYELIRAHK